MDSPEAINIYYLLFVGTLGMLLLACSAIFFFMTYYKRNIRAKEELHEIQTKLQEELIFSNIRTLEDERKRFAQDLHDEIGASLSAIRLHVSTLETETHDIHIKDKTKELKSIIDHSMASTRRISHNMLPPGLEMLGLTYVIEDLKKHISKDDGLHIIASVEPDLPRLHYNTELILYRIFQELISNTIKHAEASEVNINLGSTNNMYKMSYRDNGKGFDAEKVRYTGLGMNNIQSRSKMINGEMQFETGPGKGLYLEINIPIQSTRS